MIRSNGEESHTMGVRNSFWHDLFKTAKILSRNFYFDYKHKKAQP